MMPAQLTHSGDLNQPPLTPPFQGGELATVHAQITCETCILIIYKKTQPMKNLQKKTCSCEPDVMSADEAKDWLENNGISYEVCDTPIPVLDNAVNCGLPQDIGDEMIEGYFCVPKSMAGNKLIVDCQACGDSMIDADIDDGDTLRVELGAIPRDGDIVVASLDNDYTTKVFFTDSSGQHWLCPRNSRYDCILLTDRMRVRIIGVVRNILKQAPRQSYRECKAIVDATLNHHGQQASVLERARDAVAKSGHLFWAGAAWAVVYCVLRDGFDYEESMSEFERSAGRMKLPAGFDYPCTPGKVQRTISYHSYMRQHVDKWAKAGASDRELRLVEFLTSEMKLLPK